MLVVPTSIAPQPAPAAVTADIIRNVGEQNTTLVRVRIDTLYGPLVFYWGQKDFSNVVQLFREVLRNSFLQVATGVNGVNGYE